MKQYSPFYRCLICLLFGAILVLIFLLYPNKPSSQTIPHTNSQQRHQQMQLFYKALRVQAAQDRGDQQQPTSQILLSNGERYSIPQLKCFPFQENDRGHWMDQNGIPIYNSSYRGIVLKNVSRKTILEWEREPEVIEWARLNIKEGYTVVYQGRGTQNILTMMFLAKLVGRGKLVIVSQEMSGLLQLNLRENGVESAVEIRKRASVQKQQNANVVILLENQRLKEFLLLPRENLLILATLQSRDQIYQIQVTNILRRVTLKNNRPCSRIHLTNFTTLLARQQLQLQGLYEIQPQVDVIYTMWLGIDPMTDNRKFSLVQITTNTHIEVKLICNQNLQWYIKPERPLHRAYSLIQSLNKVDYLRAYIMHFYGSGYTDIKHVHADWRPYFNILHENPFLFAVGYQQIHEYDVGCDRDDHENCHKRMEHYQEMISNGHYILRKQTLFTQAWLKGAEETLEKHYEALKAHPAKFPRDCYQRMFRNKDGSLEISQYPIRWGELHGWIFQHFAYIWRDRFYLKMPYVIIGDYQ